MEKEVLLKSSTRDELIEELISRESITWSYLPLNCGGVVNYGNGQISFGGYEYVFVIKPTYMTRNKENLL